MSIAKIYFSNFSSPHVDCQRIKKRLDLLGLKTKIYDEYVLSCEEKCKIKYKCKIKIIKGDNTQINKALYPIGKLYNVSNVKCLYKGRKLLPPPNSFGQNK